MPSITSSTVTMLWCLFSTTISTTFIPFSRIITALWQLQSWKSPFPLKNRTTMHKANSSGIQNPSRTFWYILAIIWIPISTQAAVACTFYCFSFHVAITIIFFIHDLFHVTLQGFTSFLVTETQPFMTPSHTSSSINFITISFQFFSKP